MKSNEDVTRSYGSTVENILYPSSSTEYLGNGTPIAGIAPPTGGGSKITNISYFANVTYSLLDKYLFTGTVRRDGSSTFGPQEEFGAFWRSKCGLDEFRKKIS